MATAALAVALSDQPWVEDLIARLRENAMIVQEEVRARRDAARSGDEEAIEDLGAARRAAGIGDEEELRDRLASAASRLRESAEELTDSLRERHQALAEEIDAIAADAQTGAEGVRAIGDLTRRLEALTPDPESESD